MIAYAMITECKPDYREKRYAYFCGEKINLRTSDSSGEWLRQIPTKLQEKQPKTRDF